ncbi:hypothetical protein SAMN04488008_10318 [Maribacter orientalis]|uniref:Uncharacterized protein n=1 Tax=Maribacter orientalis TaxID=228957 RepID=A0A1H7MVJ2_9FLAO|nr:hypothetical protein [Maribacter orientalis]SEL15234.1 hypothetical protein SAMN04488008_10318 [Maribacter orientalis]
MKRYIKNIMILSLVTTGFLACESSNKTIDDVFAEITRGAVFRSTTPGSVIAAQEFSFSDPSASISTTFEVEDNAQGGLLQDVQVYSSFNSAADPATSVAEVLVRTIAASEFTTNSDGLPSIDVTFTLGELAGASGLNASDYTGGDSFTIRYALNLTDGRTFTSTNLNSTVAGGAFFRSPFTYTIPLVCPPVPPTAGTWVVNMEDTYGDGWQTSDTTAGDGITITLDDGTVFEVGLCSPYGPSAYDCTPGNVGSATVEIPAGTTTADWYFPGDAYGEIVFEIVTPNGNVAASGSPGTAAGPIAIDFCVD